MALEFLVLTTVLLIALSSRKGGCHVTFNAWCSWESWLISFGRTKSLLTRSSQVTEIIDRRSQYVLFPRHEPIESVKFEIL